MISVRSLPVMTFMPSRIVRGAPGDAGDGLREAGQVVAAAGNSEELEHRRPPRVVPGDGRDRRLITRARHRGGGLTRVVFSPAVGVGEMRNGMPEASLDLLLAAVDLVPQSLRADLGKNRMTARIGLDVESLGRQRPQLCPGHRRE